jgi:hypothetical protein
MKKTFIKVAKAFVVITAPMLLLEKIAALKPFGLGEKLQVENYFICQKKIIIHFFESS